MKRILGFWLGAFLALAPSLALSEVCQILGTREIPETASGFMADFEIDFRVFTNTPDPGSPVIPVLRGNILPDEKWVDHKIIRFDRQKNLATALIKGWPAGEFFEFSTGWKYPEKDTVFWSSPVCYVYPDDAPLNERHYRLKLGEKKNFVNITPIISLLLSEDEAPHPCIVLGVETLSLNGPVGNFRVRVSLQNYSPTGAPKDAIPMVDRQSSPYSSWTGFHPITREDNTAWFEVDDWPLGQPIEFSLKMVAGSVSYWPNLEYWKTRCPPEYFVNGHLGIKLGVAPVCGQVNTGDKLVRHIEKLAEGKYRIYLNFSDMPIKNYQALVINGQSAPNAAWIDRPVADEYPCYYSDIDWPYAEVFEFTYCVDTESGQRQCVDPTGSIFECGGHLCVDFKKL